MLASTTTRNTAAKAWQRNNSTSYSSHKDAVALSANQRNRKLVHGTWIIAPRLATCGEFSVCRAIQSCFPRLKGTGIEACRMKMPNGHWDTFNDVPNPQSNRQAPAMPSRSCARLDWVRQASGLQYRCWPIVFADQRIRSWMLTCWRCACPLIVAETA